MVRAIPSSLDFAKCSYFTSIVISSYTMTFLCGCTAPLISMKRRRVVIEHEAKKYSRHNNKLLAIPFAANQFQVRSIPFSRDHVWGRRNLLGGGAEPFTLNGNHPSFRSTPFRNRSLNGSSRSLQFKINVHLRCHRYVYGGANISLHCKKCMF